MGGGLDADARYWRALEEGRLELPVCGGCGRWQWPAVSRCGECGSWDSEWRQVTPRGTIFSWNRTRHPFAGTEQLEPPYVSVLVELADAGRIRLLGLFARDGGTPAIGQRVTGRVGTMRYLDRQLPAITWHPEGDEA